MQVALHHVGPADPEHARLAGRQLLARFEVGDLGRDAGHRPADGAFLAVGLKIVDRAAGRNVDRDQRRQLGRAVAFDRPHAELLLELVGQVLRQLLRPADDDVERLEVLRLAAAQIASAGTSACESSIVPLCFCDQLADLPGVERAEVIGPLDVERRRRPTASPCSRTNERTAGCRSARRFGVRCTTWSIASTLLPTLAYVSITPLGVPVEPLVKMTVSTSSGLTLRQAERALRACRPA